jgi:hypothetical protein
VRRFTDYCRLYSDGGEVATMFAIVQASSRDGVTFGQVISNIPHDVGAIVVYSMLAAVALFMWYGSRKKQS